MDLRKETIWFGQMDKIIMTEEIEPGLFRFSYDEKEYWFFGFGSDEELEKFMDNRGMTQVWPEVI